MIKQSLKREPSLYLEIRCLSTLATDFFFPISQIIRNYMWQLYQKESGCTLRCSQMAHSLREQIL